MMSLAPIRHYVLVVVSLLAGQLAGCGPAATDTAKTTPAGGSIEVGLEVSDDSIRTVDELDITLVVAVAPGWVVADQSGALEELLAEAGWAVTAVRALPPDATPEGHVRLRWASTVEPFLDGEYAIPAMTISARPTGGGEPDLATTEPQTVTVTSVLDAAEREAAGDLDTAISAVHAELRQPEISAPSGLPGWARILIGAGVAALAAIAAAVLSLAVRSRLADGHSTGGDELSRLRCAAEGRSSDPVADASFGLRAIIGIVTGRDGSALSTDDVRTALSEAALASESARAAGLIARLEAARFAPHAGGAPEALATEALAVGQRLLDLRGAER